SSRQRRECEDSPTTCLALRCLTAELDPIFVTNCYVGAALQTTVTSKQLNAAGHIIWTDTFHGQPFHGQCEFPPLSCGTSRPRCCPASFARPQPVRLTRTRPGGNLSEIIPVRVRQPAKK